MKIVGVQEIFQRKRDRQARIVKLEYHAAEHCVHIGKLSPGCYKCFVPDSFSLNFHIGSECNCNCIYCYGGRKGEILKGPSLVEKGKLLQRAVKANLEHIIPTVSFTGGGEPLMNLDIITEYMNFYRKVEEDIGVKLWYYLYTNGILADNSTLARLRDLGFSEIRFHIGASGFSKQVYANIASAVQYVDTVTIETPAWPPHREKLFEMLPIIEDIGVKHVNIGEVEITVHNQNLIERTLPNAEVYQCYALHLYDGGLVYDLIEEVLAKNYTFSILDCSSLVKSIQRTPGKWLMYEEPKGLSAGYEQQ